MQYLHKSHFEIESFFHPHSFVDYSNTSSGPNNAVGPINLQERS